MSPAASMRRLVMMGALLLVTACGGDREADAREAPPAQAIRFTDAAGREHVLDAPAERIVSLVPSATEAIRAMGAADALVGVTDYDDEEWAASLPSVGGGLEPNLEALVALQPDVVIRFHGEQDPRTPERLDELGIRHVAVRPVSLRDVFVTNHIVGTILGRAQAADSLTSSIRQGIADVTRAVADLPRRRVVYTLGGTPPWVSGPDSYISEILDLIGADNVFEDLPSPYQAVSPEELRSREVDVVLVTNAGSFDASLTPDARIEVVGDALQVPGPGVVEEARTIAQIIHGRSFR